MDIIQTFYNNLASQYDKLFLDWQSTVEEQAALHTSKYECEYRATHRDELTNLLLKYGCSDVKWLFPEETGFYQPIVVGRKQPDLDETKNSITNRLRI